MRYLDIARAVIPDDQCNEENEKSPTLQSRSSDGETESEYERNEIDEKSPGPRMDTADLGLDPNLRWVHVYQGPVRPSTTPEGWKGIAPTDCGKPAICAKLGACPGFEEHGLCPLAPAWEQEETA
jgi:hypothetical protein